MEASKSIQLFVRKTSAPDSKDSDIMKDEDFHRKSNAHVDSKYVMEATRHSNHILLFKEPSSTKHDIETLSETENKSNAEKMYFLIKNCSEKIAFRILKGSLSLMNSVVKFFANRLVQNTLMVTFTVSIEVFVVMALAMSTVLAVVIINLEEAFTEKTMTENKELKMKNQSSIIISSIPLKVLKPFEQMKFSNFENSAKMKFGQSQKLVN